MEFDCLIFFSNFFNHFLVFFFCFINFGIVFLSVLKSNKKLIII